MGNNITLRNNRFLALFDEHGVKKRSEWHERKRSDEKVIFDAFVYEMKIIETY